jgi:hypothetical protein
MSFIKAIRHGRKVLLEEEAGNLKKYVDIENLDWISPCEVVLITKHLVKVLGDKYFCPQLDKGIIFRLEETDFVELLAHFVSQRISLEAVKTNKTNIIQHYLLNIIRFF